MKKIDTEELMLNCYIDPNYFEETMRERFGENEEIKMLVLQETIFSKFNDRILEV